MLLLQLAPSFVDGSYLAYNAIILGVPVIWYRQWLVHGLGLTIGRDAQYHPPAIIYSAEWGLCQRRLYTFPKWVARCCSFRQRGLEWHFSEEAEGLHNLLVIDKVSIQRLSFAQVLPMTPRSSVPANVSIPCR